MYVRRLHDLVHALGAQGALDQIADCYGANEGGETGILALLLCRAVLEDLGWAEGRLGRKWLATCWITDAKQGIFNKEEPYHLGY